MTPRVPRRALLRLAAPTLTLLIACGGRQAEDGPPAELVVENMEETDVTVALEIEDAERIEEAGVYATWRITAAVLTAYKGELSPGDRIEYARTVETGAEAFAAGTVHIVSFVWDDATLMIPDAGYHFPYSDALHTALTEAGGAAGAR